MDATIMESIRAILPEILVLVLIGLILLFDALGGIKSKRYLGWLAFGGLLLIILLSLIFTVPPEKGHTTWGGLISFDLTGFIFKIIFLFGAAITVLLAMDIEALGNRGEFYSLLLVSVIGMMLMVCSYDLIMLYLAIETTSIPLYILAGFFYRDERSVEAGFKYLFFGAAMSAIMLYGFSLIYGFGGTTNFSDLAIKLQFGSLPLSLSLGSMLLVLVGFAFKTSLVPLHFWAPDVYEGAPTPVAGFLSTASKAAGFVVLMRVFYTLFAQAGFNWSLIVAVMAVFTMTLGNFLALAQRNIKRLLAYSSISHAGYALIGVVVMTELGIASVVFYLGVYLLTNLAAFGLAAAFSRVAGTDEISAYAGLSRRSPSLALVSLIALLSLAGMPPFGGFVAKVWVFAAAIQSGWIWLAVIGILNSIVGLYYYLRVLNVIYHYRSEETEKLPLPVPIPQKVALTVLSIGIILLGIIFTPFLNISALAAAGWF